MPNPMPDIPNHWTPVHQLSDQELLDTLTGPRRPRVAEPAVPYAMSGLLELESLNQTCLKHLLGMTSKQARMVAAAVELHRRLLRAKVPPRPNIKAPEDVVPVMAEFAGLDHERFYCLPMDSRGGLIGPPVAISMGDVDGTDAGPRAFYRHALRLGAVKVIAAHNHPSGDPGPSPADRIVTRKLAQSGRLVEITLEDHVIVAAGGVHYSMRRNCLDLFG